MPQFITGGSGNGQYWNTNQAASGSAALGTGSANLGAATVAAVFGAGFPGSNPEHTFEAGIRAGEIIAYRAWTIHPDLRLRSMVQDYYWTPKSIEHAEGVDPGWGRGLYAYKTLALVKDEFCYNNPNPGTTVCGEVALWGTVIEHEHGYRAEYAKITKLIELGGEKGFLRSLILRNRLGNLRQKYGV